MRACWRYNCFHDSQQPDSPAARNPFSVFIGAGARSNTAAEACGAPSAPRAGGIGAAVQNAAESATKQVDGAEQSVPPAVAKPADAGHVRASQPAPQWQTRNGDRSTCSSSDGVPADGSASLQAIFESATMSRPESAQTDIRTPASAISEQVMHRRSWSQTCCNSVKLDSASSDAQPYKYHALPHVGTSLTGAARATATSNAICRSLCCKAPIVTDAVRCCV